MHAFRIERNGNGRDFDIIPTFTGAYGHGYQLIFEILDPDGSINEDHGILESSPFLEFSSPHQT